jgi:NAD(P)H-flavin reductase
MITTDAEIRIEKELSETLFILSVKLEKYKEWIPGTFMQISLDKKNASEPWLDSKAFSFASWGCEKASILVRKGGNFTTALISKAKEGFTTTVRYPFGNFWLKSKLDMALIAGGAGISVFLSFLDYLNEKNDPSQKILLFYSARRQCEILKKIYQKSLANNLFLNQFITDRNDPDYTGRLTIKTLVDSIKDLNNFEFYICGPPEFNNYWIENLKVFSIIPKLEQWQNRGNGE